MCVGSALWDCQDAQSRVNLELGATRLQLGEPHQLRAQAKARTLASRQPDARGQQVQQHERHGGNNRHSQNLLQVQLLLGDDHHREGDRQALQEILHHAGNQLSNCETVHLYSMGAYFCVPALSFFYLKPGGFQKVQ